MVVSQFKITDKLFKIELCSINTDINKLLHTFIPGYNLRTDKDFYIPKLKLAIRSKTCYKLIDEKGNLLAVYAFTIRGKNAISSFVGVKPKTHRLAILLFMYLIFKDTKIKEVHIINNDNNVFKFSRFSRQINDKTIVEVDDIREYMENTLKRLKEVSICVE